MHDEEEERKKKRKNKREREKIKEGKKKDGQSRNFLVWFLNLEKG